MHDAVKYGNAHFYLYSKWHYQQTNPIDDLKHIISRRCAIDIKYVRVTDILTVVIATLFAIIGALSVITFRSIPTWIWKGGIAMCLLLSLAFVHLSPLQLDITRRAQLQVDHEDISRDTYQLLLARLSHSTTLHDEVQRVMADGTITREDYHDLETKLDEELLAQTTAMLTQEATHPLPNP